MKKLLILVTIVAVLRNIQSIEDDVATSKTPKTKGNNSLASMSEPTSSPIDYGSCKIASGVATFIGLFLPFICLYICGFACGGVRGISNARLYQYGYSPRTLFNAAQSAGSDTLLCICCMLAPLLLCAVGSGLYMWYLCKYVKDWSLTL